MNPWMPPQPLAIGRTPCGRCGRELELFAWDHEQLAQLDTQLAAIRAGHEAQHATEDTAAAVIEEAR